jgi:hypothetical protein
MKKILTFLLGAGLFFLSGCFVQPPYFYEAVGKKDSIVSGDSQYPDLFIEKILS